MAEETWKDTIDNESAEVQKIVRWFFARYADPSVFDVVAADDPDGRDADDILEDEFGDDVEDDVIARAVDFIGEWGSDWVPIARAADEDEEPAPDTEPPDTDPDPAELSED